MTSHPTTPNPSTQVIPISDLAVGGSGADAQRQPSASPIPCHNSNFSDGITPYGRKQVFILKQNIERLVRSYPLEMLGLATLTFLDNPAAKEANRRINNLSHILPELFQDRVIILERGSESGRWHFHLLVVCRGDIRTGFDFEHKRLSSMNSRLLVYLSMLDDILPKYGFGWIFDLQPVQKPEAMPNYLGKYLQKGLLSRRPEDKNVKLVRYAKNKGHNTCKLSWNSPAAKLWRKNCDTMAKTFLRGEDEFVMQAAFGKRWAYHMRGTIINLDRLLKIDEAPF